MDRTALFGKATVELLNRGLNAEAAFRHLDDLWTLLEALL
jgi:hypothetical protein